MDTLQRTFPIVEHNFTIKGLKASSHNRFDFPRQPYPDKSLFLPFRNHHSPFLMICEWILAKEPIFP